MGISSTNRITTVSLALGASGILTCGLALSDIFFPPLSTTAKLIAIPALAAVVFGALFAFAWACEMLDRRGYLHGPARKTRRAGSPRQVVCARGPQIAVPRERPAAKTPVPLRPLIHYPIHLRGTIRVHVASWRSKWHGQ
jgi:hypothetical protein